MAAADAILMDVDMDASGFYNELDALTTQYLGQSIGELTADANLNDDQFLAALSNLLSQLGIGATQARELMKNFGMNVKIKEA